MSKPKKTKAINEPGPDREAMFRNQANQAAGLAEMRTQASYGLNNNTSGRAAIVEDDSPADQETEPPPTEYQSLRLVGEIHKLRYSSVPKKVEAERDQQIFYRATPYPHFQVMPTGIEIPVWNVTSAIPKDAALASKVRRVNPGRDAA